MSLGAYSGAAEFFGNSDVQSALDASSSGLNFIKERGTGIVGEITDFCNWVFDLIKFDAFINFFQDIGLWFKTFEFPESFQNAFRSFMDFCSVIWNFILGITDLQLFYMWSAISVILFIIWLIQKIYDPHEEITGPNTYSWESRGTIWYYWTYLLCMALTTLYLPTMTACFNVMFCFENTMTPYELECYKGMHWVHFAVSVFVFLFIGIFLPYQIFFIITKYQPKPHQYDEMGNVIDKEMDREQYLRQYKDLLSRDTCPYSFLYSGYEYGWSLYKVITMMFKVILMLPTIPFFTAGVGTCTASLIIVALYALTSIISSPFLLPSDDWIENTARITAVLTAALQLCVLTEIIHEPYSGNLLIALNILNLVVMVLIVVGNLSFVQNFFRKHFGRLMYTKDLNYDSDQCRKKRIWMRFWGQLLTNKEELKPIADRLQEMTDIWTEIGPEKFKESLIAPTAELARARRMAQHMEGPDCYYKSPNGTVKSRSYWGQMFITPFPFQVTMVYDSSQKIIKLDDDNIIDFVKQNMDKEILLGKRFRRMIRCLKDERVNYKFSEIIKVKTTCGSTEVLVNFTSGILRIEQHANDTFVHGFKVTLELDDGTYTDEKGKVHTGIKYTLKHRDLGITREFSQTPELNLLLHSNKDIIEAKWPDLMQRFQWMREDLEEERTEKTDILSNAFFLLIYNNDHIPLDEMKEFMLKYEENPVVKSLIEDNEANFNGLYSRLKYYDAHPAFAFWYNFFDDITVRNNVIKKIAQNEDLFDSSSGDALIYHPMPIEKLKALLEERGLRKHPSCCCKKAGGLFNDKIMDLFEEKLNEACQGHPIPTDAIKVETIDENLLQDTLCLGTPLLTENTTYLASAAMTAFLG